MRVNGACSEGGIGVEELVLCWAGETYVRVRNVVGWVESIVWISELILLPSRLLRRMLHLVMKK